MLLYVNIGIGIGIIELRIYFVLHFVSSSYNAHRLLASAISRTALFLPSVYSSSFLSSTSSNVSSLGCTSTHSPLYANVVCTYSYYWRVAPWDGLCFPSAVCLYPLHSHAACYVDDKVCPSHTILCQCAKLI